MKRIVEINQVQYGSTGLIARQIADKAEDAGYCCKLIVPKGRHNAVPLDKHVELFGNRFSEDTHIAAGRLTGLQGSFSLLATRKLISNLKNSKPDVIHLHNLHGCYINLEILFSFLKETSVPVVWTLHDCWSFTGHCTHFDMIKCNKWKTECNNCPQYREYPSSLVDNSRNMFWKKKEWFTGVPNLTIVTPSEWLGSFVKQSFLKEYRVKVINNGIDLSVFKPTESNFRQRYNIDRDKKIILGVSFGWDKKKGLDVFIHLAESLDRQNYQIVLVGTDRKTDRWLPDNIVSIHRTQNQKELSEVYSAADLFVNPTREDNFPTVNMEALACGTPVLTFRTGGSPEIIDQTCGAAVEKDDIESLEREIIRICAATPYSLEACTKRAANYDKTVKFQEYVELYRRLL